MSFANEVAIDVRFHIEAHDLPGIVQIIEELPEGFPTIIGVDFLVGDGLPYEHTLPGMENISEVIGD